VLHPGARAIPERLEAWLGDAPSSAARGLAARPLPAPLGAEGRDPAVGAARRPARRRRAARALLPAVGRIAFVGGSLVPVARPNVLEPARGGLGRPRFGPHTTKRRRPRSLQRILTGRGALRVPTSAEAARLDASDHLLANPEGGDRPSASEHSRSYTTGQGAVERHICKIIADAAHLGELRARDGEGMSGRRGPARRGGMDPARHSPTVRS